MYDLNFQERLIYILIFKNSEVSILMSEEQKQEKDQKKVDEKRKELIEKLHPEDELQVEEHKLKEEKNEDMLETVDKEET